MSEIGNPTLEKIKQLAEKFANPAYKEDAGKIQQWQKDVNELLVREKLAENKALIKIISKYVADVREMNVLLLNADSETLPDDKRDRVLDKKRLYLDFLGTFNAPAIREQIEAVDKEVSAELDALGKEV